MFEPKLREKRRVTPNVSGINGLCVICGEEAKKGVTVYLQESFLPPNITEEMNARDPDVWVAWTETSHKFGHEACLVPQLASKVEEDVAA